MQMQRNGSRDTGVEPELVNPHRVLLSSIQTKRVVLSDITVSLF